MSYQFKPAEFWWFIAVAVTTATMQILVDFRPEAIADPRVYAVALVGAGVRAAAAAVLTYLGKIAMGER